MRHVRATTLGALIAMTLAGGLASAATTDPLPLLAIGPDSSESPSGGDKTRKPCDNPARQSDNAKPTQPYGSTATPGNAASTSRDTTASSQAQDCNDDSANRTNSGNTSRSNGGNDSNSSSPSGQDQNSRLPAKKSGQR